MYLHGASETTAINLHNCSAWWPIKKPEPRAPIKSGSDAGLMQLNVNIKSIVRNATAMPRPWGTGRRERRELDKQTKQRKYCR